MQLLFSVLISTILLFNLNGCNDDFQESDLSQDDQILKNAYENKISDIQVHGTGKVTKLLSDDTDGSRHQRFILKLNSEQTLLIAHNIDIAPRIENLSQNDTVEFYGEYVWNSEGGIIHWTHHDPNGQHEDGWLKHQGVKYD